MPLLPKLGINESVMFTVQVVINYPKPLAVFNLVPFIISGMQYTAAVTANKFAYLFFLF